MMAAGAGTPGGRGQRLDYTRPIYLDHLAADFPTLTIIAAHAIVPGVMPVPKTFQRYPSVLRDL